MTEFSPLQYAASAALLIPMLGMLVAADGVQSFGAILRRQAWMLVGGPLQLIYSTIGWVRRRRGDTRYSYVGRRRYSYELAS